MDPRARMMIGNAGMTELERLPPPAAGGMAPFDYRTLPPGHKDNPDPFADEPYQNPFVREPSGYGEPNALIHREQVPYSNRPAGYRSAPHTAAANRYADMDMAYLDYMVGRLRRASEREKFDP